MLPVVVWQHSRWHDLEQTADPSTDPAWPKCRQRLGSPLDPGLPGLLLPRQGVARAAAGAQEAEAAASHVLEHPLRLPHVCLDLQQGGDRKGAHSLALLFPL